MENNSIRGTCINQTHQYNLLRMQAVPANIVKRGMTVETLSGDASGTAIAPAGMLRSLYADQQTK
jgi:hypothetical protein